MKKRIQKGRSLMSTQSLVWYGNLQKKWRLFNKTQRQDGQPQVSFKFFCYNNGIDLSGKTKIDIS